MAATTSLKLPDELKQKIGELCQRAEQTPHAYMVDAIAQKVQRDEKREAFIKAAETSAAETMRTGISYAHEDVWEYLLKKARGQKARKPKPTRLAKSKR
jgi:predicted transcriptional regulator